MYFPYNFCCICRKDLQFDSTLNKTVCSDVHYISETLFKFQTTFRNLLVCIIPLCIVIPTNVAIVIKLMCHKRLMQRFGTSTKADDTVKTTVMLLSMTITYVLLMVPMTITIIIYTNNQRSYYGVMIILSILPYLNMSINFYLYFLSGRMFRGKVKEMLHHILKPGKTCEINQAQCGQVSSRHTSEAVILKPVKVHSDS